MLYAHGKGYAILTTAVSKMLCRASELVVGRPTRADYEFLSHSPRTRRTKQAPQSQPSLLYLKIKKGKKNQVQLIRLFKGKREDWIMYLKNAVQSGTKSTHTKTRQVWLDLILQFIWSCCDYSQWDFVLVLKKGNSTWNVRIELCAITSKCLLFKSVLYTDIL